MRGVEQLRYIAFGGGGVRGIGFAGAIDELWSLMRFDSSRLRGCAGTSIGALYAAALASGMAPNALLEVARRTSLIDLVRPHVTNLVMHWGFDNSSTLETWIDTHLGNKQMTFKQLHEQTGRVLRLTATDLHTCECYILDHESEPDMPICRAVAISMCLPPLFAPIEHRMSDGTTHLLVDGGICNNFPIDLFPAEETLGFKVTWGHVSDLKGFEKYFARLTYCTLATAERRIWGSLSEEYRRNTLVVDCGDVSTMNWRLPQSSVDAIIERGRHVVREFVLRHDWRALPIDEAAADHHHHAAEKDTEKEKVTRTVAAQGTQTD